MTGRAVEMKNHFLFLARIKSRNVIFNQGREHILDEVPSIHLGFFWDDVHRRFPASADASRERKFLGMSRGEFLLDDLRHFFTLSRPVNLPKTSNVVH